MVKIIFFSSKFIIMSRTKSQILVLAAMFLLLVVAHAAPDDSYNWSVVPVLTTPSNGATDVIPPVQLKWTGASGTANIEIYRCASGQSGGGNINLNGYQKVIGPKNISAIGNDLSGVTYNPLTNSLFMIKNKLSKIYETDLSGNVVRTINLTGYDDPEDIAHLYGTKFAIAEEKKGKILFVDIYTSTSSINLSNAPYTQLQGTWNPGDGIEGVSYNPATSTMYAVVEVPMELHRFPLSLSNSTPSNTFVGTCNLELNPYGITDVSAIHHLGLTSGLSELNVGNHFLLLSDESHALIEADDNCNQYSRLTLPGVNTQLEGVTMDNDGNIYVVGEPYQFYKYSNPNLDLNPSNLGTLVHNANSSGGTYTIPDNILQAGTEYCWRVRAGGQWSEVWSFTPGAKPPNPYDPITVNSKISTGNDDVEEAGNGSMYLNSSDLELIQDNSTQTIGLRFRNLGIPQGANILSAHLQFSADEATSSATTLTIRGENTNSASSFSSTNSNVSNRLKTSQSVQWQVPAWNSIGQRGSSQKTPDIKSIIQQIVNRNGFNTASNLGIIITGTGKRVADSYEGGASKAPELVIVYNTCLPEGAACDDSNPNTENDVADGNCGCAGTPIPSCTPNTPCNDNDATTYNDTWNANCICTGTPCIAAGTACNDNNSATENDEWDGECNCIGTPCAAEGTPCNDANPNTINDEWDGFCKCAGEFVEDGSVFKTRIATGNDDVEENGTNGNMYLNSTDLELVYDRGYTGNQVIGLRFTGVWLPPGAKITKAYVQFTADESRNLSGNMIIHAEATGNSPAFTNEIRNLSSRNQTQAYKVWTPPNWTTVGAAGTAERTADISNIIQEIVNRGDWDGLGRAIAIVIEGAGKRVAESYEGSREDAPMLHIEYKDDGQNFVQENNTDIEPEEEQNVEERKDKSIIQAVNIYPNPANYKVNVSIEMAPTNIQEGEITLLDMTGKMLQQTPYDPQTEHTVELDIEPLPQGIYIIQIQVGTYTAIRKLIKR